MNEIEQLKESRAFAARWRGRGYEKGDKDTFWNELLSRVFGVEYVSQFAKFEEHTLGGGFIDGMIPETRVIIEQKAIGVSLDKPEPRQGTLVTPLEQAIRYSHSFSGSDPARPHWIVVCNFETFRVYDRDSYADDDLQNHCLEFSLEDFGENPGLLAFLVDSKNSRSELERQVTFDAGALIGRLQHALEARYINPQSAESQHALNVLCVRLVFCLFCEDAAGVFPKDAFLNYLESFSASNMRMGLKALFRALDTPLDARDPYDETIKPFPHVGGGLFSEDTEIPNFDDDLRTFFLEEVSKDTDWSKISPTIFGGIFEGTLNPETRRAGGMHYTSPANIHKVIDPLFLDNLIERFQTITRDETLGDRARKNRLIELHKDMCGMSFFDPACGSGNFLTETYLCLRRLEDEIFRILNKGQARLDFGVVYFGNRVRLSQFYGIEINDFAVRVARVALFIAQLQSNVESVMSLGVHGRDLLPLEDCATIVHGNALRMPWNEVLPANKCSYIIGNPPFIGANNQSSEQKAEVQELFKDHHHASLIDYVGCWYKKASLYMRGIAEEGFQLKVNAKDGSPEGGVHSAVPSAVQSPSGPPEGYRNSTASPSRIKAAFVSTNSICQGEQVANLWQPLFDDGLEIVFAHKDFRWSNEAKDGAHVFVSIIGFHFNEEENKTLFTYETPDSEPHKNAVTNINAYLTNAPNIFITRITKPLCKIPKMTKGCQPTDGGNLIIEADDLEEFLTKEPRAEKFIKKLVGSREFIQQKPRYCLWLVDASAAEIQAMPLVKERVKACRDFRLSSSQAGTRKLADRCTTFRETYCPKTNLIVPSVCSERRKYIPIGYVDNTTISTNANLIVPEGTLYMCGILQSQAHNAWMRVVCGRLESRYRYSAGIVYNNFPWPGVTRETLETPVEVCVSEAVRASVEACAQAVLDAREQYVAQAREAGLTCSLADMYDPENAFLYPALTRAHAALDAAVEEAYGVNFAGDEERIVAHLFSLYEQLSRA